MATFITEKDPALLNSLFFLLFVNDFLFSAYDKVGQQFQIESRIISSSVHPPAGKLVEPVVIVFGGVQVILSKYRNVVRFTGYNYRI